jgi:hypothetical protein
MASAKKPASVSGSLEALSHSQGVEIMMKLIAVAAFALAIAYGCGMGKTRVGGVCVARTNIRQARRCMRWTGHVCAAWY